MGLHVMLSVFGFALTAADSPLLPEKTYGAHVPCRAIARGPASHWFSYYDKYQFDPGNRYVLGMEVDFHDRTFNKILRQSCSGNPSDIFCCSLPIFFYHLLDRAGGTIHHALTGKYASCHFTDFLFD